MRKWDIVYLLFFLLMGCNHSSKKTLNEEEVSSINEIEEEGVKVINLESVEDVG